MSRTYSRLVAAAGAALMAGGANAAVTFNVNATLTSASNGGTSLGTLTGSFTTNDALTTVIGFNLVASASGSFAGFTYTPTNASVSASTLPSQFFRINSANNANEVQLFFAAGLTEAGGVLSPTASYENEPGGGNRFASGTVTQAAATPAAVPEPGSWGLMLLGTGAAGYVLRRRRRSAARAA